MNHEIPRQRELWIDFLKITAAFMVVLLHSAAPWLYKYGKMPAMEWQFANVIDSAVRVSVPLFFMATGHLLLGRKIILSEYLTKRVAKIAIPWLAWSAFYLIWHKFYYGSDISLWGAVRSFIDGSASYHLWFLYSLAALYLFVPIMTWLFDKNAKTLAYYFISLWFIGVSLIPFCNKVLTNIAGQEFQTALDLTLFGGFSGYLVIGYLIGRIKLSRTIQWFAVGFVAVGVMLTIGTTSILTIKKDSFVEYFYGYQTPNVVIASASMFLLLRQLGRFLSGNSVVASVLVKVSSATLGIYLVHPMFLDLIYKGPWADLALLSTSSSFSIPIVALCAFILSLGFASIVLQLPFIRRIV